MRAQQRNSESSGRLEIRGRCGSYGAADRPNRFTAILVYQTQFGAKGKYALSNPVARTVLGDWSVSTVVQAQSGEPFYLTMEGDGAITSRVDRNPGQPLQVPKSLQHCYNGGTTVTLPCGATVTPPAYSFLKYNLCAFQGETLTGTNGSIIPNIYWIGTNPNPRDIFGCPGEPMSTPVSEGASPSTNNSTWCLRSRPRMC